MFTLFELLYYRRARLRWVKAMTLGSGHQGFILSLLQTPTKLCDCQ